MLDAPILSFSVGLVPYFPGEDSDCLQVNIPPSTTLTKGTILAQVTGSASCVQTVTIGGTPTGGTFTLTGTLNGVSATTTALAYNATSSVVQTALQALSIFKVASNTANVTVSGSAGGPYTVTFAGTLANTPIPALTGSVAALTGGTPTITIATTTTGQTGGTFVAYSGTVLTPTTAPTVAGNGSGSSYGAGTYNVSYTYVTAAGESIPSPATNVIVTAAQNLRVSALSSLSAAVTSVNYYVNGVWTATTAVSSGSAAQTDLTGASIATGRSAPNVNNAFTDPNGTGCHTARAILRYDCVSDVNGYVTLGTADTGDMWGNRSRTVAAWFTGSFRTTDLTGLDANAVSTLSAHLLSGSLSDGILRIG